MLLRTVLCRIFQVTFEDTMLQLKLRMKLQMKIQVTNEDTMLLKTSGAFLCCPRKEKESKDRSTFTPNTPVLAFKPPHPTGRAGGQGYGGT